MANLLSWDATGERLLESGVSKGVLYIPTNGVYAAGYVWNGLTAVTESPSGAELTDLFADDIKYGSLRAAELFGGTIEAYTYPEEFAACDGSVEIAPGVMIGQQGRSAFGFCYRTKVSDDSNPDKGYKLHLVYGATASPSEKAYQTINDSPEAITFSWEFSTTPVAVTGQKPTSIIVIDSTKLDAAGLVRLAALEVILYGTAATTDPVAAAIPARLPLPDEVKTLMTAA